MSQTFLCEVALEVLTRVPAYIQKTYKAGVISVAWAAFSTTQFFLLNLLLTYFDSSL